MRQDEEYQGHRDQGTAPDGEPDVPDVNVADAVRDQKTRRRQNRPRGHDGRERVVHGFRHRLARRICLSSRAVAAHHHDRVVDGRAHLDRGHDHIGHERRAVARQVREAEVDADASLDDEDQRRRDDRATEGEEQNQKDEDHRHHPDQNRIEAVKILEVPGGGDIPDGKHAALSVLAFGNGADGFDQLDARVPLDGERGRKDEAVPGLPLQLLRGAFDRRTVDGELRRLFVGQRHEFLVDHAEERDQNVDQRRRIGSGRLERLAVAVFERIEAVEPLGVLFPDPDQRGEFPGGVAVGKRATLGDLGVRQPRRAADPVDLRGG